MAVTAPMKVFISHDFDNKPEYENVVEWLDQVGVPHWNPAEVQAGTPLRDQLRTAVEQCSVCVFIATRKSIESNWCGAELGAFWGTGKPIIVYLAEASIPDDDLPPIVRGDVWERKISRVAHRAKELAAHGAAPSPATDPAQRNVGNMTAEQLQKIIESAVSLALASGKAEGGSGSAEAIRGAAKDSADRILEGIRVTEGVEHAEAWKRHVLWVDDRPDNNVHERAALESLRIEFTLALSTAEALSILSKRKFAVIISDMGRKEGPREGYVLLGAIRKQGIDTPYFIYAGSNSVAHKLEANARGAQGTTNNPRELFDMVVGALPSHGTTGPESSPAVSPAPGGATIAFGGR